MGIWYFYENLFRDSLFLHERLTRKTWDFFNKNDPLLTRWGFRVIEINNKNLPSEWVDVFCRLEAEAETIGKLLADEEELDEVDEADESDELDDDEGVA